jgi:hypothetical protein
MTDHKNEEKVTESEQPESIGKKLRYLASQARDFCMGAGIALATLGILTGIIVLILLGFRKFF